jgi:hypothetical protein
MAMPTVFNIFPAWQKLRKFAAVETIYSTIIIPKLHYRKQYGEDNWLIRGYKLAFIRSNCLFN